MSWFSDLVGGAGDLISGGIDYIGDIFSGDGGLSEGLDGVIDSNNIGPTISGSDYADLLSTGDSWLDGIGSYLKTPTGINTILSTGLTLGKGLLDTDAAESARKQQLAMLKEKEKFDFLKTLAQIKYGQKGGGGKGGGGSMRNKNADLIEVLNAGNSQMQQALQSLQTGYVGALK